MAWTYRWYGSGEFIIKHIWRIISDINCRRIVIRFRTSNRPSNRISFRLNYLKFEKIRNHWLKVHYKLYIPQSISHIFYSSYSNNILLHKFEHKVPLSWSTYYCISHIYFQSYIFHKYHPRLHPFLNKAPVNSIH